MESKNALERGESGGGFSEGVLGILRPQKITTPVGLVVVTVGAEESGEFLIQTFYLAVGFGVIAGGETDIDVQLLTESPPYSGRKLRTPVRDDVFRETIKPEYIL